MKRTLSGLFLAFACSSLPLHAEFRSWTNTDGVKIEAELVKAGGSDVTLKLRTGKITTFPQSKLSFADRDFIKANKDEASASSASEKTATASASSDTPKPTVPSDRKAKWLTKMDKAQEQAKETGLPILVLFTGTTWCPYCIKLEKEVFSQSEFQTFANQNLVLLMLDYGPGGAPNSKKDEKLKEEFKVKGFPNYFLTDATGKQLASGGYNDGINPAKFAEWAKAASPKK